MNTKTIRIMRSEVIRLIELIVIVAASISPLFLFASKIDDDEWWKSSAAVGIAAVAGVVAAIYRLWKQRGEAPDVHGEDDGEL